MFVGQVSTSAADISQAAGVLKEIGPVGSLLSSVTDGVAQLESRLSGIETAASRLRAPLQNWILLSDLARRRLGAWITGGAVGITLALLWFGLGQASLFVHALGWFRRAG
jgi:hypothetical protein